MASGTGSPINGFIWRPTQPRVLEQVDEVVEFNDFGVARATQVFEINYDIATGEVDKRTRHPRYPWLKRKAGTIKRLPANSSMVSISYEGVPPETNEKFYSLKASLSSAPLATHPKFNLFAVEANGAIFDGENRFQGWEMEIDGEKNPFYGVESWLVPGFIYEENWVRGRSVGEANEFEKSGEIDTPPSSPAKIRIGTRNWLFLGGDLKIIGDGSKMTRQWRLSGPDGWNSDIYTNITDDE